MVRWTKAIAGVGFHPLVLTVKDVYGLGLDHSLLKEIEPLATFERTGSLDLKRMVYLLQRITRRLNPGRSQAPGPKPGQAKESGLLRRIWVALQKLRNWFMVPDDIIGWMPFALLRARRIIRQERPEVIITSSWPQSVQLIGLVLKKWYGIPWIVDFRDSWARHPYLLYPTRLHRGLAARMEKWVVANADLVTLAYGLKDFEKTYPEMKNKFRELHNGFRESDFAQPEPRSKTGFSLLYLGAFYGVHSPEYFFDALKRLLAEHQELKSDLKVDMVGRFYPEHIAMAGKYQVEEVVRFHDFVPHDQIVSWMFAADALLLFLGGTAEAAVVPGKVFEYIRSPAWVLAMIPEGETADILRAAGGSLIVPFNQPEKIEEALLQLYSYWKKGEKPERIREYVMSKEEDYLRGKMVEFINSLI